MSRPPTVRVRARDVRPYHYALWSSVHGGPPFANDIVAVRWTPDGRVSMMLDTHTFLHEEPDTVLDLIPLTPRSALADKYFDWTLGPRPGGGDP